MLYVFDTSALITLGHYFPQRFPSFWTNLDRSVGEGKIVSAREVYNEFKGQGSKPHLDVWVEAHKALFLVPTAAETTFVGQIFAISHFQQLVGQKQRLKGTPVADPFVIAIAKVRGGCVVTEESMRPNAAKIPNVCEHFGVACCNLEAFMEQEGWTF